MHDIIYDIIHNYLREVNRRINNTDFYRKIQNESTQSNRNKVNKTIKELKLQRLQQSFLVNMDARSLYTKILNNVGLEAVETTLIKQKNLFVHLLR